MECPHCQYIDGWAPSIEENIKGYNGSFYSLPIDMEQPRDYGGPNRSSVYGCPTCRKVFLGV